MAPEVGIPSEAGRSFLDSEDIKSKGRGLRNGMARLLGKSSASCMAEYNGEEAGAQLRRAIQELSPSSVCGSPGELVENADSPGNCHS